MSAPPSVRPSTSKRSSERSSIGRAQAGAGWSPRRARCSAAEREQRAAHATTSSCALPSKVDSAVESPSPSGVPTVCVLSSDGSSIWGTRARRSEIDSGALVRNVGEPRDLGDREAEQFQVHEIARHRIGRVLEVGVVADAQSHEARLGAHHHAVYRIAGVGAVDRVEVRLRLRRFHEQVGRHRLASEKGEVADRQPDLHAHLARAHDRVPIAVGVVSRRPDRDARRLNDPQLHGVVHAPAGRARYRARSRCRRAPPARPTSSMSNAFSCASNAASLTPAATSITSPSATVRPASTPPAIAASAAAALASPPSENRVGQQREILGARELEREQLLERSNVRGCHELAYREGRIGEALVGDRRERDGSAEQAAEELVELVGLARVDARREAPGLDARDRLARRDRFGLECRRARQERARDQREGNLVGREHADRRCRRRHTTRRELRARRSPAWRRCRSRPRWAPRRGCRRSHCAPRWPARRRRGLPTFPDIDRTRASRRSRRCRRPPGAGAGSRPAAPRRPRASRSESRRTAARPASRNDRAALAAAPRSSRPIARARDTTISPCLLSCRTDPESGARSSSGSACARGARRAA